jgi:single-strand DNA-binding protein
MAFSFNKVFFIGNMVRNPEMKSTSNGKDVCTFTLAVNEGKDRDALFANCVAFGKTAELIDQHTAKGDMLHVEGKAIPNVWTDKDGHKHNETKFMIFGFVNFTLKNEKASQAKPKQDKKEESKPEPDEDGDLPF